MTGLPTRGRWRGHAFGLALDSSFAASGWEGGEVPPGLPRVTLGLETNGGLRRLRARQGRTIARRRAAGGGWQPEVIVHESAYLMDETPFGLFGISRGGRTVSCAPPRLATWRWQRYLFGRVLPFAAVLRGFEPWHASGVALDGEAIALAGGSGAGKSSLAAALVLGGARLLADDVLALSVEGSSVRAHPSPGLMSIRHATARHLGEAAVEELGRPIGRDANAVRVAVPRHEGVLPLSSVYLLERGPSGTRMSLRVVRQPDPRLLLGSTFNFVLTMPRRLVHQLEVCAATARHARVLRVTVPAEADPRKVAERVAADWQKHARAAV